MRLSVCRRSATEAFVPILNPVGQYALRLRGVELNNTVVSLRKLLFKSRHRYYAIESALDRGVQSETTAEQLKNLGQKLLVKMGWFEHALAVKQVEFNSVMDQIN